VEEEAIVRERRAAPRYRCQMPCVLRIGAKRHDAKVLDLSSTGLSVRTEIDLAQGDEVELTIEPAIQFQAIAWRTMRTRTGFVIGMMLSNQSSAFDALVARQGARQPAPGAIESAPKPPVPPLRPRAPDPWWRVRVKEVGGNRTRLVALAAPSRDEAIARSLAEIGSGWEILEAELTLRAPTKPN
jgi:hypothetical protein